MQELKKQFTFVIWKEDKYYVAQCLNVDVSSFGETYDEAYKNLQEAVELYFENEDEKIIDFIRIEQPTITVSNLKYA